MALSEYRAVHYLLPLSFLFLLVTTTNCTEEDVSVASSSTPVVEETSPTIPVANVAPSPSVPVATPAALSGAASNETFIAVAKRSRASVVNISSTRKVQRGPQEQENPFFNDPFFRRFFGEEFKRRFRQQPQERRQGGMGSGVIVSDDGYIITNNHVVENADEIEVLLGDKRKFSATLVGTDPKTDLAVIKIKASQLSVLPWGNSGNLQVGEMVMAVGNPFGLNQTVTLGIISAVGRANMGIVDYEDFIQTDAAINPGNSGGALVNLRGELIGINTAIFSRSGGYMGIGFAIPSNMVKNVMTSLRTHGKVVRGWLGVNIQEITHDLAKQFEAANNRGALVTDVVDGSPAEKAKFKRGDIIIQYNGTPIKDPTHLRTLVSSTPPDTNVTFTVFRDKQKKEITVHIEEMPQDLAVAAGSESESVTGNHALAGVTVENLSSGEGGRSGRTLSGVQVTKIQPGSPAESAGLRPGDIIREVNRKPVKNVNQFDALTSNLSPNKPVLILLTRGRSTIFLSINPGE